MKKIFLTLTLGLVGLTASAQLQRQQDNGNVDILRFPTTPTRTEITIPDVNGFKSLKVDLHVHTTISDGSVSPEYRVQEAWQDGLDAIAITDHIEYRPGVKKMVTCLGKNIKVTGECGINTEGKVSDVVNSDLNVSYDRAAVNAERWGITVIRGTEITRNPVSVGHFNALFTTDNNTIPDPDPLQSIRNAKKQGALIQNNHPGWRRSDAEFTDVTRAALKEGLIDGIEVFNNDEFYPRTIDDALENKLYITGGTDIHWPTRDLHAKYGHFRTFTIVFAKENTAEAIKEALENCRTLAYSYGDMAGEDHLVRDLFLASCTFKKVSTDSKGKIRVQITNNSSLPYVLALPGNTVHIDLPAHSSVFYSTGETSLELTVANMWCGKGRHPQIQIKL